MTFNHTLFIGGSGMLRQAARSLANQSRSLTLVARDRDRLTDAAQGLCNIHTCPVDYADPAALASAIRSAIDDCGEIDLTVAWIHETAPDAPLRVARTVGGPGRFIHVLSSSTADPTNLRSDVQSVPELVYQEVVLGFVVEAGRRARWLRHDEICAGVLRAVADGQPRSVVGTVRPWSARP